MCSLDQIQNISSNPGVWTVLFISISTLGIYISAILIIRDRFRGRQRTILGLYAASLSILLFHLTSLVHPVWPVEGLLDIAGSAQLFLIGPFSFLLLRGRSPGRGRDSLIFHLIPAALVFGCLVVDLLADSTVYVLGIVHTGIYLFIQSLSWIKHKSGSDNRDYRLTAVQIVLFLGISITSLTIPMRLCCFVASAGIALLILLIWIRLLYTAYLSYIISIS